MSKKTNFDYLREILKEFENFDSIKAEEGLDFLEAIENEYFQMISITQSIKEEYDENEDKVNDSGLISDFVGLDTIQWKLEKKNLKIQMQVEKFIEGLQKQNCATASKWLPVKYP